MDIPLVTEAHAILIFEGGTIPLLLENAQADTALPFKLIMTQAQNSIFQD